MNRKETMNKVDAILNMDSTTWQEKKNMLVDFFENIECKTVTKVMHLIDKEQITRGMSIGDILKLMEEKQ